MAARDPKPTSTDPARSGPSALGVAWALLVLGIGGFVVYSNVNPPEAIDLGTPIAAPKHQAPGETAAAEVPTRTARACARTGRIAIHTASRTGIPNARISNNGRPTRTGARSRT